MGRSLLYADEPGGLSLAVRSARRRKWTLAVAAAALVAATLAAVVTRRHAELAERDSAVAAVESYWDYAAPDIFRLRPGNLSHEELNFGRGELAQRHLARFDVMGARDWRLRSDIRALRRPSARISRRGFANRRGGTLGNSSFAAKNATTRRARLRASIAFAL